ncbi:Fructosamine kinase-domain-containing protein [Bombardia bombarda]|uniref:protein-ribulosamine 3-kinase n=1 Tax=Bombardia bombarda TaxID=252184 RepID=A0AA39X9I5_9PEZI|nr:Fructosamine kinase-domain-containing protein [Bombardia bombarda]
MNYDRAPGLEFGGDGTKIDPSVAASRYHLSQYHFKQRITNIPPTPKKDLPPGSRVTSTSTWGRSFWPHRRLLTYLQLSRNLLHQGPPQRHRQTNGPGRVRTIADTHLFLCEFKDLNPGPQQRPDPVEFAGRLAALHQTSRSPTGKFGFHITTFNGNLPQDNEWEDCWEVFFTKSMRQALEHETAARGADPEVERARGGRSLVHGDLCYWNAGVDLGTGMSVVFDACSFYAHNEYELGQWRPACNKFGPEYVAAYHSVTERSEPVEDYDGRVDLYKLRFNTRVSALFWDQPSYRTQMIGDMKDLIQRYG